MEGSNVRYPVHKRQNCICAQKHFLKVSGTSLTFVTQYTSGRTVSVHQNTFSNCQAQAYRSLPSTQAAELYLCTRKLSQSVRHKSTVRYPVQKRQNCICAKEHFLKLSGTSHRFSFVARITEFNVFHVEYTAQET